MRPSCPDSRTVCVAQIVRYPPLNRQYRVIDDFADRVIARL
jgi:hypothetical protein